MKTKLILGSFLALAAVISAQTNTFPSTGNAGIGTTSPAFKLDLTTSSSSDGIRLTQTGTQGAVGLELKNNTNNGRRWGLFSLGTNDAAGSGNFSIYDLTSGSNRFFISGTTGNIGVGTVNPGTKLHVSGNALGSTGYFESTPIAGGNYVGIKGIATSANGISSGNTGVEGSANSNVSTNGANTGVNGNATGGAINYGGKFVATGIGNGLVNGAHNWGIWAEGTGGSSNSDAAAFLNGLVYYGSLVQVSDINFKTDVKPLDGVLNKLKLLKPSTYLFKTDENYKRLHLAEGQQMGLIAQDLEKVFPELVSESESIIERDEKGNVLSTIPKFKAVNYVGLIPFLIAGMQDQQQQIENQQQLINQLLQKSTTSTGLDQNSMGAAGFKMEQNEPNPFNGVTTVKYTLPSSVTNAYMAVYDLSGKQIASFPITEKGSSAITLTSEKLAAGIYIYSIVADNKIVDSKRMIVAEK